MAIYAGFMLKKLKSKSKKSGKLVFVISDW